MIKNRSFLIGLGSGLITGALLLQLMISGGAAPLTKEQVLKGAERLNLTLIDKTEVSPVDEPQKDTVNPDGEVVGEIAESPEVTTPSEPIIATSPSPVVSPEEPNNTDKSNLPVKPSDPSTPVKSDIEKPTVSTAPSTVVPEVQKVTQNGVISVDIPNGSTLNETATILADLGVIKDKNLFLRTAMDRKINKIIRYGKYSFDEGEEIDSIIDKLIRLK